MRFVSGLDPMLRNDTLFYELCDELGLYVVDEANIESHGVDFNWDKTLGNKDRVSSNSTHVGRAQGVPVTVLARRNGEQPTWLECSATWSGAQCYSF